MALANFSIKISRKGTGLETTYSILPKVRKVPDKIAKEWESQKESIWLPNFLREKILSTANKLTRKVFLLAAQTNVVPTYLPPPPKQK